MATERQMQANRQNALKSTGPKSSVGKMISACNSTRHGFYATAVLLPDDDHDEFIRLARRLVLAYAPCGALEEGQSAWLGDRVCSGCDHGEQLFNARALRKSPYADNSS